MHTVTFNVRTDAVYTCTRARSFEREVGVFVSVLCSNIKTKPWNRPRGLILPSEVANSLNRERRACDLYASSSRNVSSRRGRRRRREGKNKDVVNVIWTSVNVAIRRRVASNKIRGGLCLAGRTITGTELRNKCYEIERQPGRDRARSSNILSVSDGSRPRPFVLRPG